MNSRPSNCKEDQESVSFELLHEKIKRWVWEQGWTELRDAQEKAIKPILSGTTDVIIASPTASGKTEAAFLPIFSKIIDSEQSSVSVLYISPLKALINDQFDRITEIGEKVDVPVTKWHGDVSQSQKRNLLRSPKGILLITPESLEAIFVNHGTKVNSLFKNTYYVVIDELHSFIGTERGRQLQSLISRIEFLLKRKIPRIALSATLGDMELAAQFLRNDKSFSCLIIVSESTSQEVKLLINGYKTAHNVLIIEDEKQNVEETETGDFLEICKDLYRTLRGASNLVFANSKNNVEKYADRLRRLCEENIVPNEFFAHHGSLSKEIREEVESFLKDKEKPTTAVCSSTLELGIDIGMVKSVAQVGCPTSVSSMRQRLGRSGRRNEPAILRIYIQEEEIGVNSNPIDRIRAELVETISMVELLIKRWFEPPTTGRLHLSTLIQQILSVIVQIGGAEAGQLWQMLCENGPFKNITKRQFADLLRSMGNKKLISQAGDGILLAGELGERIVNNYDFYTAFKTPEEYQLFAGDKVIGSIPITFPLNKDLFLIFSGRRWKVTDIDESRKTVYLIPARGGVAPKFSGRIGLINDEIRKEMYRTYLREDIPLYLDNQAKELLLEGKKNFLMLGLDKKALLQNGADVLIFLWKGDKILNTLLIQLLDIGLNVSQEGVALNIARINENELTKHLEELTKEGPADPMKLASSVKNKLEEKYDHFLSDQLLNAEYASRSLDTEGVWEALSDLLNREKRTE